MLSEMEVQKKDLRPTLDKNHRFISSVTFGYFLDMDVITGLGLPREPTKPNVSLKTGLSSLRRTFFLRLLS